MAFDDGVLAAVGADFLDLVDEGAPRQCLAQLHRGERQGADILHHFGHRAEFGGGRGFGFLRRQVLAVQHLRRRGAQGRTHARDGARRCVLAEPLIARLAHLHDHARDIGRQTFPLDHANRAVRRRNTDCASACNFTTARRSSGVRLARPSSGIEFRPRCCSATLSLSAATHMARRLVAGEFLFQSLHWPVGHASAPAASDWRSPWRWHAPPSTPPSWATATS
jgi:hypothetical protein